jgi:hypothetical protein
MDRYFKPSQHPIPPKVLAYGTWVREHTAPIAVFVAGSSASSWIPALAGRRVLLAADARPPADYAARKEVERALLAGGSPEEILRAARPFGITHLAVDRPLREEYGDEAIARLTEPVWARVFENSAILILELRGAAETTP